MSILKIRNSKRYNCEYIADRGFCGQYVSIVEPFNNDTFSPRIAHIIKVDKDKEEYTLTDKDGNEFTATFGGAMMYDLEEWIYVTTGYLSSEVNERDSRISILKGKLDLLTDILVKQGVKVISKEQFDNLGIDTKIKY